MARAKKEVFPRYTVWRDTSEKLGWQFDESDACAGTVDKNLYTADYSIDGFYDDKTFVIERKGSVGELAACVTQKERWDDFRQELERLEEFKFPFVVCEFPLSLLRTYPRGSGIPPKVWPSVRVGPRFLLKRLEEIWLRYKTKFLFADAPGLGKEIASGLFKRVVEHDQAGPSE